MIKINKALKKVETWCKKNNESFKTTMTLVNEPWKSAKIWFSKNVYKSSLRKFGDGPAVCDICGRDVGFSDYFYMCKDCGHIYYGTRMFILPKFVFRFLSRKVVT